ncbi:alpha/beta hydrolase [Kiritimatiellota bacterium B12222]|nr:alpha/beta hydrolase [Kiritimatiellota bacterium B12222]
MLEIFQKVQAGVFDAELEVQLDLPVKTEGEWTQTLLSVRRKQRSAEPSPAFLWFHGGGFEQGSPEGDLPMAKFLAYFLGITVFSASYRLFQGTPTYPGLLHDAGDAWRWIQQHAESWQIHPEKVAVGGGSAGGYLSTMLTATLDDSSLAGGGVLPKTSQQPAALVCLWGPLDFVTRWFDLGEMAGPESKLFGGDFLQQPVAYYRSNPLSRVKSDLPPALFLYGSQDRQVAPRQGRLGCQAWVSAGNKAEYCEMDNVGHDRRAQGQAEADAKVWQEMARFLKAQGVGADRV